MARSALLTVILLFCIGLMYANSVFSFYGYPDFHYGHDGYAMGMGHAGFGDLFRINTSYGNPSLAVTAETPVFSTTMTMGWFRYKDQQRSFLDDGLSFPQFHVTIPWGIQRFGVGLQSVASGNFENFHNSSCITAGGDTLDYVEENRVQSNIYRAGLLWAIQTDYINAGIEIHYYLGQRIRQTAMVFDSPYHVDTRDEITSFIRNPGISLGLSRKWERFSLGLSYTPQIDLEGEKELITVFGTNPKGDAELRLPSIVSGGCAVKLTDQMRVALDINYEMWKDIEAYPDQEDAWQIGAGWAYDPDRKRGDYWEKIPLRCGFSFRRLPFNSEGNPVNEQAVTFGFSLPLDSPARMITFGLKYGIRGNVSDNGLEDETITLSFGTVGFDIFRAVKRRIEDREIPRATRAQ